MQELKGIINNQILNTNYLAIKLLATGLVVAMSAFVTSGNVSAEDPVVDDVVVNVPISCTLAGNVDTEHTDSIQNGHYSKDIGTTTLKATCNDIGGFSIYAIGFSGDQDGITNMIGTNPDNIIITGTATSGPTSNWSMKLSTNDVATYPISIENNFDKYSAVPSSYAKVATRGAVTDLGNASVGSVLTSTYAVFVSNTQYADTYTGKVKYTLVHPASEEPLSPQTTETGKICYYANNSKAVGTMGCQDVTASPTLLASNFSLGGYGFAGWSDQYDYATNQNAHFYGPQETITINTADYTGDNDGLSLYAVWVKSAGSLQDTEKVASVCDNLTKAPTDGTANLSSVSALTDQRDNNTYAIAKLADGNCWMIENLRLESTNSDNSTGALAQGYGKYSGTGIDYGNFAGLADAESTNFKNSTTANSLYYSGTQSGDATINIGTTNNPGYRMPRYNNWNNQSTSANRPQNPTTNSATNSTTNAGMYSYGNYYTWHAAIADLTYNGTDNKSTTGTSLCPAGWHLPTGGSVTTSVNVTETPSTWREFYNLGYGIMGSVANDSDAGTNANYNNTTTNSAGKTATAAFRSFPNNFLYSGVFATSSADNRGSKGDYWSSTARNSRYSYILGLNSSSVYPGTIADIKYYGYSIRCLAGS